MSRRHLGGITAAVLAGALLTVAPIGARYMQSLARSRQSAGRHRWRTTGPAGDGRQGGHGADPEPRAAAEDQQARRLRRQEILTSGDLNYAPYERTWRGLPVVGGDFVVVTDDEGHVLTTSVAQTSTIKLSSTTPTRPQGPRDDRRAPAAEPVRKTEAPRLVVWQGKTSHLAWETRVTRPRPRPPLDPVRVRRRPLRQVPVQQGARRRGHRQRQLGGHRHHPDVRLRLVVLDDEQQRDHPESARTPRATSRSPAPTTSGATASRRTARPAAWTRSTRPRRCAR